MNAYLNKLFEAQNPDTFNEYIDRMDASHFSLVTFVDTLIPALVWESNLQFGSFHLIKMSLFIRNLARRKYFSAETELALAKVILQHLSYLEWTRISADPLQHMPDPIDEPVKRMLSAIEKGNAHNAYFYALTALQSDKEQLFNALLKNGAISIPDTIGHSISCFYPVLEDVLAVDHPAAATSLLSLILYLCRFRNSRSAMVEGNAISDADKNRLLLQAASGTSILDIHHMITFYTLQAWETATWNKECTPPWEFLTDWIGEKEVDESQKEHVDRVIRQNTIDVPESYEAWQRLFAEKDQEAILDSAIALLRESSEKACDWLFRVYAEYYTPDWDPHYFTSLYAALELRQDTSISIEASTMAFIQALKYFVEEIICPE